MKLLDSEGFVKYLEEEEKSSNTITKYVRDTRAFFEFADGAPLSKAMVVKWKKKLESDGYKPTSINSMIASLNAFLRYAGREDCIVRSLKIQRQLFRPVEKELSKEEYFRLIDAAEGSCRIQLILQTLGATGARVSELRCFTVDSVSSGEICINCKGKIRKILIPDQLREQLLGYAEKNRISDGSVFRTSSGKDVDRSNVWHEMKMLCEQADVDPCKVFPHNLRRLFAREFYSVDKDISKLADVLGHSSINTTRIYIMTSGKEHKERIENLGLLK